MRVPRVQLPPRSARSGTASRAEREPRAPRGELNPADWVPGSAPPLLIGASEWEQFKADAEYNFEARPKGAGARSLGGRTADELTENEQKEFLENQRRLRTDPRFRASVEGLKGALSKINTKGMSLGGGPAAAAGGTGGEEPPDDFVVTPWGTRDLRTGKFAGGERGGKDPVQDFIEHAKANGFEVVGEGEITVETPFVNRRPDVVLRNPQTGRVGGVEIKSTPREFAKRNASQAAADRWINTFGARAVGRNAENAGVKQLDYMMKIQWPPN